MSRYRHARGLGLLLILCALAICLNPGSLCASKPYQPQQADPFDEPWLFRTFTALKGLGLRCLAEGQNGLMWFGVTDGIVRFGGENWSTFGAADGLWDALVNTVLSIRDGTVYAGTASGISRFEGAG